MLTFKKDSIAWDSVTGTLRLGIAGSVYDKKHLYLPVALQPGLVIPAPTLQIARLVEKDGVWSVHLVYRVPKAEATTDGHWLSVDLGQNVVAATACTDGSSAIYSGGELLALDRYFEKEKMVCNSSRSAKRRRLDTTRSRQRHHFLHCLTRSIISDAKARGVTTLIVGDVTDIRTEKDGEAKNWGDLGNQKFHAWPFKKITDQLMYKGAMVGIAVHVISEAYTSQDCSCCNKRRKANRKYRGLYVCNKCGMVLHADINGAINILKKYAPEVSPGATLPWSSGQNLACPSVNRFAWRETKPKVHGPGTWYNSYENTATVERLAA